MVFKISQYFFDISYGSQKILLWYSRYAPTLLNTPTVVKISPHGAQDIPHGTEHTLYEVKLTNMVNDKQNSECVKQRFFDSFGRGFRLYFEYDIRPKRTNIASLP